MLKHAKVSGKLNPPDTSQIGGEDWDREHSFSGDATGGLLVRDSALSYGADWITAVAVGRVLVSGGVGARPAWSASPSITSLTLSSPLTPANGGTGLASYAVGDLLYASGAAALAKLADVAAGSVLVSGGVAVAPAWSASPALTSVGLGDGLVGSPAAFFTGEPTTGIYRRANGRVTFAGLGQKLGEFGPNYLSVDSDTASIFLGINGDVIFVRDGAANTSAQKNGNADQLQRLYAANGAYWERGTASELVTLSTGGTTTDTSANLLPANSLIEAVVARVTTTITTATDWRLGDSNLDNRFTTNNSTLASGTTDYGVRHVTQPDPNGPWQALAAKVRITTTGTPGAGAIRVVVFYRRFVAPTS